jgi:hypothetical protein
MEEMIPAPSNRTEDIEVGKEAFREVGVMLEGIPNPSNRIEGQGVQAGGLS